MKRILMVVALAGALASSIHAGEVPTVGFVQPTHPTTAGTTQSVSPSETLSGTPVQQIANDAVVNIMLTIIGFVG